MTKRTLHPFDNAKIGWVAVNISLPQLRQRRHAISPHACRDLARHERLSLSVRSIGRELKGSHKLEKRTFASVDRDFKLGLGACAKAPGLKVNDGLAAEAAVAKLFERLARAVQFNHGADTRSDRAILEHVRDLVQTLRR